MNLHHEDIPQHVIDAALTLKNHATMQGWGGLTGDGLWSLHGIGDISGQQKEIQRITAERDQWKANHDNQVELKRALMDRPDLGDRASRVVAMHEKLLTCRRAIYLALNSFSETHYGEREVSGKAGTILGKALEATRPL